MPATSFPFEILLEQMADAVYVLDPQTSNVVWGNRAAWESLGLTQDEVLHNSVLSLQKDVTGLPQWSEIAAVIRSQPCFTFVGRHRHADGHELDVEVNTTVFHSAGQEYFLSIARDISRRLALDTEFKQRDKQLSFALNEASDGLWDWEVLSGEVFFSPRLKRMLGYGPDEMVGRIDTWKNNVHPDDLQAVIATLNEHMAGRVGRYDTEYRLRNRNGDYLWVHDRGRVSDRDAQGAPLRVVGMVHDITERKVAEQKTERLRAYQELVFRLSSSFIKLPLDQIDGAINDALGDIGRFFAVDRGYVISYDVVNGTASNTHEWCAEGISPEIDNLQALPFELFMGLVEENLRGQAFVVDRVSDLPPGYVKSLLEAENTRSLVTLPLMRHGQCVGCVGFDSVHAERRFGEDEMGLLGLFAGLLSNLEERRLADEVLRQQQQSLQLILDAAPIGIWLQDGKGRVTFANKAFCQAIGVSEAQFLAVPHYAELIHKDFRDQCLVSDAKALASETVQNTHERLPFVDGQIHDLHVIKAVRRDEAGKPLALLGLSIDISEQLRQEQVLRDSEYRFRNLLENVDSIAVQGYGPDRRVIFWNAASEKFYGYTREEALGRTLDELIIPEAMRATVISDVARCFAGESGILPGELTLHRKDGSLITVYSSHVRENLADTQEMYCIDIDVSERKRAEAELDRYRSHLEALVEERTAALTIAKETAEAASRAKTSFLANMSHELRTPMNAIMGMTNIALRRTEEARLCDPLRKIDQAAHHLMGVINDILDISKIEAERLTLEDTDFQLAQLLEKVDALAGYKARDKNLQLNFNLAPGLALRQFSGDPLRLQQIFLNLLTNAIKFTAEGAIEVRGQTLCEKDDGIWLRFEVADTGMGIDETVQKRLFLAFEQADNSMTRKYGGTGLGLAISKRLVNMMGGEIGVESSPGQGCVFWFTVQLGKAKADEKIPLHFEPANAESTLRTRFAGRRILVVEDEPINVEVMFSLLDEVKMIVDVARDGVEAVQMAREQVYALILMDVQMPNLNGLDATRVIRQDSLNGGTPILALTANAFEEDRQACLNAGMNDHVGKPVEPQHLFEAIVHWLSR